MKLRSLPAKLNLKGKRVVIRVDWNVPITQQGLAPEDILKIEQSISTIQMLVKRGAIIIILTHLGRPKRRDQEHSTRHLAEIFQKKTRTKIYFHPESVTRLAEHDRLSRLLSVADPGSIHLLENVRFEMGEEENDEALAKAYASLGDYFMNDAFASSHRAHASVVGIAKQLPSFAGPNLVNEVSALSRLLTKPRRPFVAVVGGLKISTKLPVLDLLLHLCDRLLIGGAMATTVAASMREPVGASLIEPDMFKQARVLGKSKKVFLPVDVVVTHKGENSDKARTVSVHAVHPGEMVMDVGPETIKLWSKEIDKANSILWNGPVGVREIPEFAHGSLQLAKVIGKRVKGKPFGVVGGGDTDPLVFIAHAQKMFDHISMGGGALLDFLAEKGKLPGLLPLVTKSSKRA